MKNKGLYWIKFASQASSQKHLGLNLDKRLTFDKHLKNVSNKIRQKKYDCYRNYRISYQSQHFLQYINVS